MTAFPYFIEVNAGLHAATKMMERHGIRHLPVKDGDELIGVVSDRDVKRAKDERHVGDIVVRETYIVDLNERLDSVLLHLAKRHIGCALIVKEGRLAGIFTTQMHAGSSASTCARCSRRSPAMTWPECPI